ncbi:MAG: acyl carrier protein [Oscillospiraceae bacterium]|nr:acyl carrier protein [Oscillospiraceae bacterium]
MFEQVKEILMDYTNATEITENSALEADLGLSSFDVVSIVTDFEDKFQIEIPDRDIGKFISVKDILEYLEERV